MGHPKTNKHMEEYFPLAYEHHVEVHEAFSQYVVQQGYAQGTCQALPFCIKELFHWLEYNGKVILEEVEPKDIQAHYQYLSTRPKLSRGQGGLSSSELSHHVYAIRVFFTWLVRIGGIDSDPLSGLSFPKPKSVPRVALSQEEIQQLFSVANTTDQAILALFYGCGLRRREAQDLNMQDVNLSANVLVVRSGKFDKRRELPLNEKTKDLLHRYARHERVKYLNYNKPQGQKAFMVGLTGERMRGDTMYDHVVRLGTKAKLENPVYPHRLRHSIATHLKDSGMPMHLIQQFLGHASLDVTELYLTGNRQSWRKKYPHRKTIHQGPLYGDI